MQERVTVAAVVAPSNPGDIAGNLPMMLRDCREAVSRGAQLDLFPELSGAGFIPKYPQGDHASWLDDVLRCAWRIAQPVDGELVHGLRECARETGVLISAGMLEKAGNVLRNAQVLVGEDFVWGCWRKMHIPLLEKPIDNGGGVPHGVDTPLGRIGIHLCVAAFLPESTRLLGVQNAEIVWFPFAPDPEPVSPSRWLDWAGPVLRSRCAENGAYGVALQPPR